MELTRCPGWARAEAQTVQKVESVLLQEPLYGPNFQLGANTRPLSTADTQTSTGPCDVHDGGGRSRPVFSERYQASQEKVHHGDEEVAQNTRPALQVEFPEAVVYLDPPSPRHPATLMVRPEEQSS